MPSYSTNLRLIQPSVGEYPGSWGTEVNNSLTALVDRAIAGTANITMTAGNYTLNNANGVDDDGKAMFLVLGGTPGASYQVICPAISKLYFVTNSTGFAQTVKTAAGSGISVPNGASMTLRCDGTNVVNAMDRFLFTSGSAALPSIAVNGDTDTGMWAPAANTLAWSNNGAETMRLDASGSLGIGETSPLFKLDARGASGTGISYIETTTGNANRIQLGATAGLGYINATAFTGSPSLQFQVADAEKMRLDASGNLGLGVTPSAWTGSGGKNIEIGATGNAIFGSASLTTYTSNANFDSSWKYTRTGFASRYEQQDSAHRFYTAPSGTAGNAISFTEAMTLDSSGNLGLGGTPSAWVSGSHALQVGSAAGYTALSQAVGGDSNLTSNVYLSAVSTWTAITSLGASRYQLDFGAHKWYTAPSGTAGNAISFTEALTLDANRNLLLNGTTAGASAVGTLAIFNGTAPTGSVTDGVILFAQDISSSSELRVRDEAGNVTTLSPHNFSLIPEGPSEDMAWAYYSEKGGKRINVDMLKLARMVENLTGEKLVYES